MAGCRDEVISRLYRYYRGVVNSRRNVSLKQLQKEWERLGHEEEEVDTFFDDAQNLIRCRQRKGRPPTGSTAAD